MTTALVSLGLYAVIVVGLLVANHRWHVLEQPEPEHVNWLPFLPPVPAPVTPPFTQAIPDASWFAGLPVEILSDDAVHSLFDSIVDEEFS